MGGLYLLLRTTRPLLAIAFIPIVLGCVSLPIGDNADYLRFMTIGRIPVVEGMINGKRARFIIDTGASCSLLDESASEYFDFKFRALPDENVTGLSGESKLKRALDCVILLGPLQLRHHIFKTQDMLSIVSIIERNEHIVVSGIIGADILDKYQITIDFRNKVLLFPNTRGESQDMYTSQDAQKLKQVALD
jgi:hypothetical protein